MCYNVCVHVFCGFESVLLFIRLNKFHMSCRDIEILRCCINNISDENIQTALCIKHNLYTSKKLKFRRKVLSVSLDVWTNEVIYGIMRVLKRSVW